MADTAVQQPAKPGTACLGCRRRKLKCSRVPEGCSNCLKSDLPCVYPAPENPGVKRKRGPYRKDKPARERHLEDLVKYLEPSVGENDGNFASRGSGGGINQESNLTSNGLNASRRAHLEIGSKGKGSNPEDLVKDALIALTRPPVANGEPATDNNAPSSRQLRETEGVGPHPSIGRIFDYWNLFVHRFDPLTKVIHCSSFIASIIPSIEDLSDIGPAKEALLLSIYYAAVTTCSVDEVKKRFGESRESLLQIYGRNVEASLADNYGVPELESLQALVVYMIAIRREDNTINMRALFSLAVRTAQMMGLGVDPAENYSPFEAELRRRLWWHICALESRGAEEGGARSHSIMEDRDVELPANYFDSDLFLGMERRPQPRTGCTDMTFLLLRLDTIRTVHRLWRIRKRHTNQTSSAHGIDVKGEQREMLEEFKARLETQYLRYLDESRPYDWLCINFAQLMLIKTRLVIDHSFGQVPTKQMGSPERLDLLQSSASIIRLTNAMKGIKGAEQWAWYCLGWNQWHSLAIVISYLGWSTNKPFSDHAWSTLDPMLARWDKVYRLKRDEPAWDHVNALIERARRMRSKNFPVNPTAHENDEPKMLEHSDSSPRDEREEILQPSVSAVTLVAPIGTKNDPGKGQHYETAQSNLTPSSNQPKTDVPFQTGCAPIMFGFEEDFGSFQGLDDIDFSAFDAVFGDTLWDFTTPSTDWSTVNLDL